MDFKHNFSNILTRSEIYVELLLYNLWLKIF